MVQHQFEQLLQMTPEDLQGMLREHFAEEARMLDLLEARYREFIEDPHVDPSEEVVNTVIAARYASARGLITDLAMLPDFEKTEFHGHRFI